MLPENDVILSIFFTYI